MDQGSSLSGTFIVFEGIDGSGKTTAARRLGEAIGGTGREVVMTREPGGTALGEEVRAILLHADSTGISAEAEALLFAAARAQHVVDVIKPALVRGAVVICDRFTDSTLAYQWGGRGLAKHLLLAAQELATAGVKPELKLLFDLPVKEALTRRFADGGQSNRLDAEAVAFHERVRAAYHALVDHDGVSWRVIDASVAPDEVWAQVIAAVAPLGVLPAELITARDVDAKAMG